MEHFEQTEEEVTIVFESEDPCKENERKAMIATGNAIEVVSDEKDVLPNEEDARSLGDRIDALAKHPRHFTPMMFVALAMVAILVAANVMGYIIAGIFFYSEWHLQRRDRHHVSSVGSEVLEDIAMHTIPFIQEWYSSLGVDAEPLLNFTPSRLQSSNSTCLDSWFSELSYIAPVTTPEEVEFVLKEMGLLHYHDITDLLEPLLQEPTSTDEFLQRSLGCLKSSPSIANMACQSLQHSPHVLRTYKNGVEKSIVRGVLLESLTSALINDYTPLQAVLESMETQRDQYESFVNKNFRGAKLQFLKDKM